jgi:hypothetical protein
MRIEYIRGRDDHISPSGSLPPGVVPAAAPKDPGRNRLRLLAIGLAVFALLCCFLIPKLNLNSLSDELRSRLFF